MGCDNVNKSCAIGGEAHYLLADSDLKVELVWRCEGLDKSGVIEIPSPNFIPINPFSENILGIRRCEDIEEFRMPWSHVIMSDMGWRRDFE